MLKVKNLDVKEKSKIEHIPIVKRVNRRKRKKCEKERGNQEDCQKDGNVSKQGSGLKIINFIYPLRLVVSFLL